MIPVLHTMYYSLFLSFCEFTLVLLQDFVKITLVLLQDIAIFTLVLLHLYC